MVIWIIVTAAINSLPQVYYTSWEKCQDQTVVLNKRQFVREGKASHYCNGFMWKATVSDTED